MPRPYKQQLLFAALGFCFRAHGYGQREKIDEAFGVLGVVAAHGEAGEVRAVERERRNAFRNVERALPQFEADGASDALLRNVEKSIESFAQRRKPQTVVDQLGVTQRECLLKMRGLAIDGEPLQFLMGFDEKGSAGSFVSAARFHSDEAILDEIRAADALAGAAVRKAVGSEFQGNFRLALGDNGPGHGSAEQVGVFVNGAGAESP